MANIATMSTSKLRAGLQSAKSTLSRMRAGAEEAARRSTVAGTAVAAAYGTGYLRGNAERDNKSIGFGGRPGVTGYDVEATPYTLAAGIGMTLVGALAPSLVGETLANVALGAGIGALSADIAFIGQRHGIAPKAA